MGARGRVVPGGESTKIKPGGGHSEKGARGLGRGPIRENSPGLVRGYGIVGAPRHVLLEFAPPVVW